MAPTQTAPPTPLPVKPPKPAPPQINLVPFAQKDPNQLVARLERERTMLEDRLNDSATVIAALERHIAELHAYYDPQPEGAASAPEPAPEPA